jgi:TPR repeat protein
MRRRIGCTAVLVLLIASHAAAQQAPETARSLFDQGMNHLVGGQLTRNDVKALDSFRESAELGYAPAQVVLGSLYERGVLVSRAPGQAATWYKKAAEQGDVLAQWLLGKLYASGDGVIRDLSEAEKWLQKAADQGDPFGAYLLGLVKDDRDYRQAPRWFELAAKQGLPQAQRSLGRALKEGRGIAQSKAEAYVWLLLASVAGDPSVQNDLSSLEAELDAKAIQQAKERARTLQETTARPVAAHGCTGWRGEFSELPSPPPPELQKYCR